jgi:hypothetical protein
MLLMLPTLVQAQHIAAPAARVDTVIVYAPMGPGALAETSCFGGRIIQVVDMNVLGTDLEQEIIAHEEKHAEQILRRQLGGISGVGDANRITPLVCPGFPPGLHQVNIEAEAFCASRPVRMRVRGESKEEADAWYIELLTRGYNFGPGVTDAMVRAVYLQWCG